MQRTRNEVDNDEGGEQYEHHDGHTDPLRPGDVDTEAAIARIDEYGERVKRSQLERALHRLSSNGEVDPATRDAVEVLADRLTTRLLAPPRSALRAAADDEADAAAVAIELFGRNGERGRSSPPGLD